MKRLRDFLLENLGLKGISVLLAFLLWFNIASQQRVQRSVSLPIEFVNMPSNLEISNDYAKEIEVVLQSEHSRTRLDDRQLAFVFDMRRAKPGVEIIPLSQANIRNLPVGVQVLSVNPNRLRLQLERTAMRIVGVKPDLIGKPSEGFEITDVRLVPSEVKVTGPESRLQVVSTAQTEPVDLSGRSESFTTQVFLDLEDPRLRIDNTTSVTAFVHIEEKRRVETVRGVPVGIEPSDVRVQLLDQTVDVTGTVPVSFSGRLNAAEFRAVVNLTGLEASRDPLGVFPSILPPPDVAAVFRVESVEPEKVRVRLSP